MTSNIHEIEKKALNLPVKERGKLIHNLILSLDSEELDKNVEQEWIEESKKRIKDFKNGKTQSIPFEKALKNARDSMK